MMQTRHQPTAKFNHGPVQKLNTKNIRLIEGEKGRKRRAARTTPLLQWCPLQASRASTLLTQATSSLSVEGEQRGGLHSTLSQRRRA
jgi:hypothetical protein